MPNVEDVSVELVKEYLSYEPDTGLIYWVKSPSKNVYAGELAGCNKATRKDKMATWFLMATFVLVGKIYLQLA